MYAGDYNGSDEQDRLQPLVNTNFIHMGLSIDPCEEMINTYPEKDTLNIVDYWHLPLPHIP